MKYTHNVFNSDAVNRDGTRFSVGALFLALWDNCTIGNPMLLSHDLHRPIGWTKPLALHFEPGLTRLFGVASIAETDEESEYLVRSLNNYLQKMLVDEHQESIQELKMLLADHIRDECVALRQECVAVWQQNIAVEACPNIFALQDKDGLVPLTGLRAIGPGVYQVGNLTLFAHSFFRRSLSRLNNFNSHFLMQFQRLSPDHVQAKIALDPDMVGLASTYQPHIEHEYWWGPKFDDDLSTIPPGVTHHESDETHRFFHGISGTQFWWQSRDGQHIFEAEEVRDLPTIGAGEATYGCRYVHSIVDEETNQIFHFDGAIRMYSEDQMIERLAVDLARAGRHTHYTKLWRLDGNIPKSIWKRILSDYFRDNHLVGEYLGAPQEVRADTAQDEHESTSAKVLYVPYSMAVGSGVRIALTCVPRTIQDSAGPYVLPLDTISWAEEPKLIVESEVIELQKVFTRIGGSLTIPDDVSIIHCKDEYVNLPLIVHNESELPQSLSTTHLALKTLIQAWLEKKYDLVLSYNVAFPIQDKEIRLSVLGHIVDIVEWLAHPLSIPPTSHEALHKWTEQIAEYLQTTCPITEDTPPLYETLMSSGILLIRRKLLDPENYELDYSEEQQGLLCKFQIPAKESTLVSAVQKGELIPALALVNPMSQCSKCQQSYISCACSKFLDQGVTQEITSVETLFPFWTDRPIAIGTSD